jgi:phosphoribosylaminoimidazole-succinocarboxamide synthase
MIASDRISAFDVILPHPIPYKGQVLNQIAAYMLKATADICPNWLLNSPAPNASIGLRCQPFKIELVVRATLTGHAWRTYASGERILCGAPLPEGMKENDFFPTPIITPSTKAAEGHDEDISPDEIIAQGLATPEEWRTLCKYALSLFERGQSIAESRGLMLADTKYEFGKINNEIYLMDEIHTPDSSRYFIKEGFDERQLNGERQKQLSKEFVREWLIANNFMGKEGQQVPEMTPTWINEISNRYIELYEKVIGEQFIPKQFSKESTFETINSALELIKSNY